MWSNVDFEFGVQGLEICTSRVLVLQFSPCVEAFEECYGSEQARTCLSSGQAKATCSLHCIGVAWCGLWALSVLLLMVVPAPGTVVSTEDTWVGGCEWQFLGDGVSV